MSTKCEHCDRVVKGDMKKHLLTARCIKRRFEKRGVTGDIRVKVTRLSGRRVRLNVMLNNVTIRCERSAS